MPRKTDTAEAVKETETQAAAEEVKQENLMYVGPTIPGIGIQNRVYTEIPEAGERSLQGRTGDEKPVHPGHQISDRREDAA